MKILIINYEHPPLGGGGGVCTKNLAAALVKKGHLVHILTTGAKFLPKESIEDGVSVFRVPVLFRKDLKTASNLSMFTFPLSSIPRGLKLCLRNRYDIINTHFYAPSGPTGLVLSLLTGIPNVLYIHGADVYDPTRMNKTPAGTGALSFLLRLSAKIQNIFTKAISCQSTNTRDNIKKYTRTVREVTVIPLPFERPFHPGATRKDLGLKKGVYYLLSAGRVVRRKGYDYLIEAMKKLDPKINLIILGDGPELPHLKKLAEIYGMEGRIIFLGYVEKEEDKFKYYNAADLYVLSSVHEGMGIVLQEAMEFGLPIVATDHGGQVDLVKDGFNGLLVPPGDPEMLAAAIKRIYGDKKMGMSFGKRNLELIKRYYSMSIADEFLDFFKIHAKKRKRP
ncbi:MAG: glycosyltransferase family 4 protein [Spirochaetes bacterium]|jgi:glycosyltransferase involved in cell wall biosynthesis|nr:glycosyltransferase family 4 protein [Spirochaetota bacterium]